MMTDAVDVTPDYVWEVRLDNLVVAYARDLNGVDVAIKTIRAETLGTVDRLRFRSAMVPNDQGLRF